MTLPDYAICLIHIDFFNQGECREARNSEGHVYVKA
jgi:hypothetical protein